jgi:phosphotransferase system enzyme I (PtsP)
MPGDSAVVSRRLLGRIRDVMAKPGLPEERLNVIVRCIAEDMRAAVCSCYVMRAGEVLELFATEGLRSSAVHQTRLRVGEGLVGFIAAHPRSLALSDAWSHPNFVYRPETGEEPYRSFLGVPIVRGARVAGVLVVQTTETREFDPEEIEALETVAMVLAELLTAGNLIDRREQIPVDGNALVPLRISGLKLSEGLGVGSAYLHRKVPFVKQMVGESPEAEAKRFDEALERMHQSLDEMLAAEAIGKSEYRDILEAYRLFAADRGWIERIRAHIRGGLSAEAAVQRAQEENRIRMQDVTDLYLRERLCDLEDLTDRLMLHLMGLDPAERKVLPSHAILVARTLGPADLLDYDLAKIHGVVLEEGSPSMHVAIIARALNIPMVARVPEVLGKIGAGDPVIVDGDNGSVFIRPAEDVASTFVATVRMRREKQKAYATLRDLPAETGDGVRVSLLMNAGLLADIPILNEVNADGIGLYRTELPFMVRSQTPDVEVQTALYRSVIDHAGGRPVCFRTLDVGGDKMLPYWQSTGEENPAMGWRSIRITLDHPAIMRQQLRALIRAAAGRPLSVMFPMIAEVAEFEAAHRLLDLELARAHQRGEAVPGELSIGCMVEVPSIVFQLPQLLQRVDFLSVGSNDLAQFLFARDRGNQRIAERYDLLSPPFLSFLERILAACDAAGKPCSLCGEMAASPLDAMALVGLGFRRLSVNGPAVGPVKAMIRSMNAADTERIVRKLIRTSVHSLRTNLAGFALDHGVQI